MAILTPLSLEEAHAIGALYGLEVTATRPLQAGSVNSNFEIVTTSGRRFLRIYEEQTSATAAREAALLSHLATSGVPTPEPIPRVDGRGFVTEASGKPVAVFPFLDGEMICQRGVTPEKARAVGEVLAQIHRAGRRLTPERSAAFAGESRFGREALLERLTRVSLLEPAEEIRETAAALRAFLERPASAPRAVGLIHGDIFRDNVLWRGEAIAAVLDFESASFGSLAFDVMVTVLAWCFGDDLDEGLSSSLFAGYRAVEPVSAELVEELHGAGLLACARFTTTRLTDFELRPRGTTIYKDFRRWRDRGRRLEVLGVGGLSRALGIG